MCECECARHIGSGRVNDASRRLRSAKKVEQTHANRKLPQRIVCILLFCFALFRKANKHNAMQRIILIKYTHTLRRTLAFRYVRHGIKQCCEQVAIYRNMVSVQRAKR